MPGLQRHPSRLNPCSTPIPNAAPTLPAISSRAKSPTPRPVEPITIAIAFIYKFMVDMDAEAE